MNNVDDSYPCSFCGIWIQNTGNWFCEECNQAVCNGCGTVDHEDGLLCPECFAKEIREVHEGS